MVAAHANDAWTRMDDRAGDLYGYTVFIAGFAAPLFLFLAGLTLTLAASMREVTIGHAAAASQARWRALQIFALAFIFRLQSQLLGWGPWLNFFKVDILNVMGVAMIAAALLWGLSAKRAVRVLLFASVTAVMAMTTPLVREAAVFSALPDLLEAYLRPLPGLTTFALFPWAAFLLGGTIAGELIFAAKTAAQERRLQLGLLATGVFGCSMAYWLSFKPSIYAVSNFWTSSPTFFFIRLGLNTFLLPLAWSIERYAGVVITTLGRSSLFVYWVHVEMVYGVTGRPLRRMLPVELSLLAALSLCALLYLLVRWKDAKLRHVELKGPLKILSPVLK
jgi:uncharacterized membrane protein